MQGFVRIQYKGDEALLGVYSNKDIQLSLQHEYASDVNGTQPQVFYRRPNSYMC